ncbi:hypothetical protein [Pandoraea sp. PE-S2T-3]|uniref:hypothetical protein n=1 Tax=Pandoraea sp. PE-S2T-3 TaxID=1986993 RepID=UPI000B3FCD21|nr:hypothetical protein [Pandoraea sp. PE-S2T-3]
MSPVSSLDRSNHVASAQESAVSPTLLQRVHDARAGRERRPGDAAPEPLNNLDPVSEGSDGSHQDAGGFDVASIFRDIWIRKQWVDWFESGRQRYQEIGGM